ncbi:MAG TPA: hypothetical protein VNY70_07965 [Steroidobacteraceae bacterium]|nr:hypothetical protein [Steroidobacteraceae bacterium]
MQTAKVIGNSPFMVGVSGHRDLDPDDSPRLREAVTNFVQRLKAHLPDTDLRLIVGMAQGADLLVAETALGLGVAVEAVLPMPLEQYAADFDPPTLACLKELLRRPEVRCFELSAGAAGAASGPHSREQRDAMYANLTDTLIRRSSLLLALWDGRGSDLPGGTADTVLRYLGVRTDDNKASDAVHFVEAPDQPENTPRLVYWTPALRSGATDDPPVRSPCYLAGAGDNVLQVLRTMPERLARQLAELNSYNLEYRRLSAAGRLAVPESLIASLPAPAALAPGAMLEDIDVQYGKADALAVYYQRRSDLLFDLFAFMAFAMGVAYLIYEKLTESRALLIAYLATLLTSLGVYYVLQGKRWFGKHLTYRALAETLRARFYLRLADADQRMDAGEVLALSGIERFRGFSWIGFVLKGIEMTDDRVPAERGAATQSVEEVWIEGQFRYFTRKVAQLEKASRRVKHLRHFLFVAILVVISLLFVFGDELHRIDVGLGIPLKNILTFSMGFMAVLLGVWELHRDKMATRELLWQYRNQLSHFAHARAQLARMSSPRRRNDVLVELGKDSLMESYLWAIHRYHREHEPPAA